MQIKIEIDLKPEELRRFLGLPDVAGLQEDVIQFLRDKIGTASESFDPASFVKDNLQTLSKPWKKIMEAARARAASLVPEPEPPPPAPRKRAPRKAAARKRPRHKPQPAHRPEPAAEVHQARAAEAAAEPAAPAAGDSGGQE